MKNTVLVEMIIEFRKKNSMSQETFLKELHSYSNGECSIGYVPLRKLEAGEKKTRINAYDLIWVFKFTGISPNEFFNWNPLK